MILLWTGELLFTLSGRSRSSWFSPGSSFAFAAQSRVDVSRCARFRICSLRCAKATSPFARAAPRIADALGEVLREVNALGDTLREQRLGALEATALLRKVMEEIDVAVFAFDGAGALRLVNRAGERILNQPEDRLLGRTAHELGLSECLQGETPRIAQIAFPGKSGRWEIHRGSFREGGLPHQLLVITDLSRALREEERQAWQRLIRVLGHELNNSLAPIKSVAENLGSLCSDAKTRAADWQEDMRSGLNVIAARTDGLARFMNAYARLAKLPPPVFQPVDVGNWVRRVAGLEPRLRVELASSDPRS